MNKTAESTFPSQLPSLLARLQNWQLETNNKVESKSPRGFTSILATVRDQPIENYKPAETSFPANRIQTLCKVALAQQAEKRTQEASVSRTELFQPHSAVGASEMMDEIRNRLTEEQQDKLYRLMHRERGKHTTDAIVNLFHALASACRGKVKAERMSKRFDHKGKSRARECTLKRDAAIFWLAACGVPHEKIPDRLATDYSEWIGDLSVLQDKEKVQIMKREPKVRRSWVRRILSRVRKTQGLNGNASCQLEGYVNDVKTKLNDSTASQ